jgi:hypothetical protein
MENYTKLEKVGEGKLLSEEELVPYARQAEQWKKIANPLQVPMVSFTKLGMYGTAAS